MKQIKYKVASITDAGNGRVLVSAQPVDPLSDYQQVTVYVAQARASDFTVGAVLEVSMLASVMVSG